MARKWAISLATAIDDVMNILPLDSNIGDEVTWALNFKTGETTQKISFTIKRRKETDPWESNFTQLEAALSLGLFGDKILEDKLPKDELSALQDKALRKLEEDWLRSNEHMERYRVVPINRVEGCRLGIESHIPAESNLPMLVVHEIAHAAESVRANAI